MRQGCGRQRAQHLVALADEGLVDVGLCSTRAGKHVSHSWRNERAKMCRGEKGRTITPPPAMVALISVSSSSSPRMASCRWRGVMRFTCVAAREEGVHGGRVRG